MDRPLLRFKAAETRERELRALGEAMLVSNYDPKNPPQEPADDLTRVLDSRSIVLYTGSYVVAIY
jgi:hypothetical protein